jgi:peroxiredoxin
MKQFLIGVLAFMTLGSNAQITTITPGQSAPDFSLKNVDNKFVGFKDYSSAKGFIVVFTCNTCPVAKAYEQRIIALDKKYASLGFPVIAINPNDPSVSPGDGFAQMQERAKDKQYPFPYLYDESQKITNLYGARNTPHVFLVKKTAAGPIVEYSGAIDNDPEESKSNRTRFLEQAIDALLHDQKPPVTVTKAIGCTVKRKAS